MTQNQQETAALTLAQLVEIATTSRADQWRNTPRLLDEIKRFEQLVESQQATIDRLTAANRTLPLLDAKINALAAALEPVTHEYEPAVYDLLEGPYEGCGECLRPAGHAIHQTPAVVLAATEQDHR